LYHDLILRILERANALCNRGGVPSYPRQPGRLKRNERRGGEVKLPVPGTCDLCYSSEDAGRKEAAYEKRLTRAAPPVKIKESGGFTVRRSWTTDLSKKKAVRTW